MEIALQPVYDILNNGSVTIKKLCTGALLLLRIPKENWHFIIPTTEIIAVPLLQIQPFLRFSDNIKSISLFP
jgi:hypothetical protein